tara:strand:+ start:320 stop:598 length:279 start_codon:yes stop_codon:yes gene_type:complete
MKDQKGPNDLEFIIDDYRKTINQLRERNGYLEEQMTVLRGAKKLVEDFSAKVMQYHKENDQLKKKLKEVEGDNKKLAKEIEDRIDTLRKSGI